MLSIHTPACILHNWYDLFTLGYAFIREFPFTSRLHWSLGLYRELTNETRRHSAKRSENKKALTAKLSYAIPAITERTSARPWTIQNWFLKNIYPIIISVRDKNTNDLALSYHHGSQYSKPSFIVLSPISSAIGHWLFWPWYATRPALNYNCPLPVILKGYSCILGYDNFKSHIWINKTVLHESLI